jgi:hypothetical protein
MSKANGGPAFPGYTMETDGESVNVTKLTPGMSLRDWFAAAALQGCLAHECNNLKHPQPIEDYAKHAYRIADAMLAARGE